jgi:membrane-bound lytic murein transglycosylase D
MAAAAAKPSPKNGAKATRGTTGDAGARRSIAGGATADDASMGAESPDLAALRDAERELFPPASPAPGAPWASEAPMPPPDEGTPTVVATGLPPSVPLPPATSDDVDLTWLGHLEMPDLPVRWDPRVVRYLQFFRDDPFGHATFANLYRRSGRYRDMMRRVLRRKSLPEDLAFVAMVESAFDPTAHSPAGALGLWQFMPETAKIYGLTQDHWLDQRMSATASTEAAATFLGDLHRRFGSWELALAGFNMGYVGLSSVVRRFNTNDFWSLARIEGTLPWETTLYVPRVIATAIVAHNPAAFGLSPVLDPPLETDEVEVAAAMPLALIAQAAGCPPRDIESLNPELRASRTPPAGDATASYAVKVPRGKGPVTAQTLARLRKDQPPLDHYVVRFGDTLDQIARERKTTPQKLVELNAVVPGETLRGGTLLLVPRIDTSAAAAATPASAPKTSVVVPSDVFVYPNRKRVFYRVLTGDTLKEIASALHTTADELRQWNDVDPSARLEDGMTLQAFVPDDADLSRIAVMPEEDVRVLAVGSDDFFSSLEHDKGFKRVVVRSKAGETIEAIGKRYGVTARTMERVNRRARADVLMAGDAVVVYVPNDAAGPVSAAITAVTASNAIPPIGVPNGPLPAPPLPELLP